MIINMPHNGQHGIDIILHIGHFHIADSAAGRQLLELSLKGKLIKGIDGLGYMNVVTVGNIIFVGNTRNDSKPGLKAFGELIGSGLQGSSVKAESNVGFLRPFFAGVI